MKTYFETPQHPEGNQWNHEGSLYYYPAENTYILGKCIDQLLTCECKFGDVTEVWETLDHFFKSGGVLSGHRNKEGDQLDLRGCFGLVEVRKLLLEKHQEYMIPLKEALATEK